MTSHSHDSTPFTIGLGWWNIYFIAKIALYFQGIIDFHPMENFALLIFILLPISMKSLNTVRHIVVFVAAAWLLHYDSYLPPLDRLWAQAGQLMQFELSYLVELLGRFLSFQAILGLLALCGAYFILSKFVRVSVFVVIAMIYISMPMTTEPPTTVAAEVTQQQPPTEVTASKQPQITEINDASLNTLTADFFSKEASRLVTFDTSSAMDVPFDLLFLSICSVAWDDIEIAGLADHPLFKEFDIMFDNFSSATSYSGPAVNRNTVNCSNQHLQNNATCSKV